MLAIWRSVREDCFLIVFPKEQEAKDKISVSSSPPSVALSEDSPAVTLAYFSPEKEEASSVDDSSSPISSNSSRSFLIDNSYSSDSDCISPDSFNTYYSPDYSPVESSISSNHLNKIKKLPPTLVNFCKIRINFYIGSS